MPSKLLNFSLLGAALYFFQCTATFSMPLSLCALAIVEKASNFRIDADEVRWLLEENRGHWTNIPLAPDDVTQIFYPFGGADALTPVLIAPNVRTIVSAQLHPFGNLAKAVKRFAMTPLQEYPESLNDSLQHALKEQGYGMTSSGVLDGINRLSGGVGILAIFEIVKLLGGRITDIKYLNWINGEWTEEFPSTDELQKANHGKITFEIRGKEIEYYLLQADLADQGPTNTELFTHNYVATKILTHRNGIGIPQIKLLLREKEPLLSVVKAIHQASKILTTEFKGLMQVLNQSDRIYLDRGIQPISSFPNHRIEKEYGERNAWFGTGSLVVLKKN